MSKASIYFTLTHVDGKHDVKEIKNTLNMLPGVESVSVNDDTNYVAVDYDTTGILSDRIQKKLEKAGFEVKESSLDRRANKEGEQYAKR